VQIGTGFGKFIGQEAPTSFAPRQMGSVNFIHVADDHRYAMVSPADRASPSMIARRVLIGISQIFQDPIPSARGPVVPSICVLGTVRSTSQA